MPAFTDNSEIFLKAMQKGLGAAGEKVAEIAVEGVQNKMLYGYHTPHGEDGHTAILDTGALFDSIEGKVKRASQNLVTVTVTAGTEYASYVHNGTYKLEGRPFITDGVNEVTPQIKSAIETALKNA